jgi:UDP-N-acetyl-D-mannosaminuronic acid dehydrogenase
MEFRKIGIVGTGYIGTVIACVLADQGFEITAIDVNVNRIKDLLNKKLGISEPGLQEMFERNVKKIKFSSKIDQLQDSEVILVTVGTPLNENMNADLSGVEEVARNLASIINKNTLICIKSTVVPGTCERFVKEIERISDLKIGEDFFLAFSPERLAEGKAIEEFKSFPIVVGSDDHKSGSLAKEFWEKCMGNKVIQVSSFKAAELTKLANNVWVDLNIALANAISLVAHNFDVNSDEIIDAANSLPKGDGKVNILRSSIGVGGSCLTKDPIFFANLMDSINVDSSLIRSGRDLNNNMPFEYCKVVEEWVKNNQVNEPRVSIIGLSFKSDTDDLRYTPMVDVYKKLKNSFNLKIFDPIVKQKDFCKVLGEKVDYSSLEECFEDANIVVLGCAHRGIGYEDILKYLNNMNNKFIIIDGRGGYPELRKMLSKENYINI